MCQAVAYKNIYIYCIELSKIKYYSTATNNTFPTNNI